MGVSEESIQVVAIGWTLRIDVHATVGPKGGAQFARANPQRSCLIARVDAWAVVRPVQPIFERVAGSIGSVIGAALEPSPAVRSASKLVVIPGSEVDNEVCPAAESAGVIEPVEVRHIAKVLAERPPKPA